MAKKEEFRFPEWFTGEPLSNFYEPHARSKADPSTTQRGLRRKISIREMNVILEGRLPEVYVNYDPVTDTVRCPICASVHRNLSCHIKTHGIDVDTFFVVFAKNHKLVSADTQLGASDRMYEFNKSTEFAEARDRATSERMKGNTYRKNQKNLEVRLDESGKVIDDKSELDFYINYNKKTDSVICPECGESFKRLKDHIKSSHSNIGIKKFYKKYPKTNYAYVCKSESDRARKQAYKTQPWKFRKDFQKNQLKDTNKVDNAQVIETIAIQPDSNGLAEFFNSLQNLAFKENIEISVTIKK